MRLLIQRALEGSVRLAVAAADAAPVGAIGPGLVVLVGIGREDTEADAEFLCRKLLNVRVFDDPDTGKSWDKNVMQRGMEVLLISQFTLYGVLKGNKPDFHNAMGSATSRDFYDRFVQRVRDAYEPGKVKEGAFGEHMLVGLVNDGPVTLQIESNKGAKGGK